MTESLYHDHKKTIQKLAWKYCLRYGKEFEELEAEGNLLFCEACIKFNPAKGILFNTYLYGYIDGYFKNMMRHSMSQSTTEKKYLNDYNPIFIDNSYSRILFSELLEGLSEKSKIILEIVNKIEKPISTSAWSTRITKKDIKQYIENNYQIKNSEIEYAFLEIKSILKEAEGLI